MTLPVLFSQNFFFPRRFSILSRLFCGLLFWAWWNLYGMDGTKAKVFFCGFNAQLHVWRKPNILIATQTPDTSCQTRWWRGTDVGDFCRRWAELLHLAGHSRVKCAPTKLGHQWETTTVNVFQWSSKSPKRSKVSLMSCLCHLVAFLSLGLVTKPFLGHLFEPSCF